MIKMFFYPKKAFIRVLSNEKKRIFYMLKYENLANKTRFL